MKKAMIAIAAMFLVMVWPLGDDTEIDNRRWRRAVFPLPLVCRYHPPCRNYRRMYRPAY